jgi:hypothetical protein
MWCGCIARSVFRISRKVRFERCPQHAPGTWQGANLLLERAVLRLQHEAAMGRIHPASFGLARAMKESTSAYRIQSCSPVKDGSTTVEAGNVCVVARETVGIAVRTP